MGANVRGTDVQGADVLRSTCPGAHVWGAYVLRGQMSGGGRCPRLADVLGANVQVAGVLRGQKSGGTSPGSKSPGASVLEPSCDVMNTSHPRRNMYTVYKKNK